MTEEVALGILGPQPSTVHAQTDEGGGGLLPAPALDGQAAQQSEATAIEHVVHDALKPPGEQREREVPRSDGHRIAARAPEALYRHLDLGDLCVVKVLDPIVALAHLRTVPGRRALNLGRQVDDVHEE
jgi:hypothetical protein